MLSDTTAAAITVAVADLVGSAVLVALTVTVKDEATEAGGVYNPFDESVPHAAPVHPEPDMLHVTVEIDVPVTTAANCWGAPAVTVTVFGLTATATTGSATPFPARASAADAGTSLGINVRAPVKFPADVGVKTMLKVLLWFGPRVKGTGKPLRLKPFPVRAA